MSQADNQQFLETLLQAWDPDIDLSAGSEAQTLIIAPILQRIGIDPFDEEIATFITSRLQETHPDLAITEVDAAQDTLIDPMRVLIEPLIREVKLIKRRTDLGNASALGSDEVESLLGNFYERRNTGGYALGTVRAYFANPQGLTASLLNAAVSKSSALRFFPTRPQTITAAEMALNIEGQEYYFDILYKAEQQGDEYNVAAGEISDILQLPTATRVTNLLRFRGGTPHESSSDFVTRVEKGLAEKTLNTQPGVSAVLRDSFPEIVSLLSVGAGELEMNRDIVTGGSLGDVITADATGRYIGYGTLDDTLTTVVSDILVSVGANFIQKLGAQGTTPEGWYCTVTFDNLGIAQAYDLEVTQVVSDDSIKLSATLPLTATNLVWMLRRRTLTLSNVPGGIVFPNTVTGELETAPDSIHIGGHTDIYISGSAEEESTLIENLSDENPLATGVAASTTAASADVVILDAGTDFTLIEENMSLVLGEGVDAGSYRIIAIDTGTGTLTLEYPLTGTQSGLVWRVVDEIDVELTDPKEIRLTGSDMQVFSGLNTVGTTGSVNFVEANVQIGDTLELTTAGVDGDYSVDGVTPTELTISPTPTRSFTNIPYRVFRRSGALETPIVRVKSVDLTDSSGSPVGTTVPYRDPVYVESRGFANEGDRLEYDNIVMAGYITQPIIVTSGTWTIELYNTAYPTSKWETFTIFAPPPSSPEDFVDLMNTEAAGKVVCSVLTLDRDYPMFNLSQGDKLITAYSDLGPIASSTSPFTTFGGDILDGSNIVYARQYERAVQQGDAIDLLDYVDAPPLRAGQERWRNLTHTTIYSSSGPTGSGAHADYWYLNPIRPGLYHAEIGKPSVGVMRAYFLEPTSVNLGLDARATIQTTADDLLIYRPDPDNRRQILPAPPSTILPENGSYTFNSTTGFATFTDSVVGFPTAGLKPGDLVQIIAYPILSSADLPDPNSIDLAGYDMFIALDDDSPVQISFAADGMTLDAVIDFINDAMGVDVASRVGDKLRLANPSGILTLTSGSPDDARTVLLIDSVDTTDAAVIDGDFLEIIIDERLSDTTYDGYIANPPAGDPTVSDVQYTVWRYIQRISSTEMSENVTPTGLYYADFEMLSLKPGNEHNTSPGEEAELEGHESDGYRLSTENSVLSYSRAEVLYAEFSRSLLLPGSSDSPSSAVQLSSSNIRVTYDRSQLVDDVQSFVLSDRNRVLASNPLIRHLLPNYVSLDWTYIGGSSVPVMEADIRAAIEAIDRDDDLEVSTLVKKVRSSGASSVYANAVDTIAGRVAPRIVVVYHDEERRVRARIVTDIVDTGRIHKFFADGITLTRTSTGGIS